MKILGFSKGMWAIGVLVALTFVAALPSFSAERYTREVLVPGHGFSGIHGLTFGPDGKLYVGSVIGQSIYRVDPETGESETFIGPPAGMADDLEFGPDGTLVWTSFTLGIVHAKRGAGPVQVLARGLLGINSIAFNAEGRLFATQVFLGDALYEIDLEGKEPPRKILEGMGGLNGFDFGPDGLLYGPLWFKGQVAKVDVDSGALTVVADGFETPAAVNFDSKGNLWVLDTKAGTIYKVDVKTGAKTLISRLQTAMDNLAFDSADRMFVTVMANNAIYEVDTTTGDARMVKGGALSVPCDIDVFSAGGTDTLYLSDLFALRSINGATGEVTDIARNYADEIDLPINISVNEKHILVCSWFSGSVQMLDRATGKSIVLAHDFVAPVDVLEMPNGDWLVLQSGGRNLLRVSGPDKTTREVIAEGLTGAVAMVAAGDKAVYATLASKGRVVRVDLSSGKVKEIVRDLALPEGIAIADDGALVVAEVKAKRLIKINPKNGKIEVLAEDLPIGLPGQFGVPASFTPTGVAIGASGTIYMTSDIENAIYKFSPR